jgi:hypothetical protein
MIGGNEACSLILLRLVESKIVLSHVNPRACWPVRVLVAHVTHRRFSHSRFTPARYKVLKICIQLVHVQDIRDLNRINIIIIYLMVVTRMLKFDGVYRGVDHVNYLDRKVEPLSGCG